MNRILIVLLFGLLLPVMSAVAAPVVSPFAGSELRGDYSVDFDRLAMLVDEGGAPTMTHAEGRLESWIYAKPEAKSNLEVLRSYQSALEAAGFDILLALDRIDSKSKLKVKEIYGRDQSDISERPYKLNGKVVGGDRDWLQPFPDGYLAAKKRQADGTVYVAVLLSNKRNLYLVDVLTSAAMEENTVSISEELLASKIEAEGKVAVYDIFFDTGSAEVRADSEAALAVIASYLTAHSNMHFYVVGHTDDTGSLETNMDLSSRRAQSVVDALVERHGVARERLEARGVGPLVPVGSNANDTGRAANRRVELVLRLRG